MNEYSLNKKLKVFHGIEWTVCNPEKETWLAKCLNKIEWRKKRKQ